MYSRNEGEPTFGHYGQPSDDQYFRLIYGTGSKADYYAIKSDCTGKVIFSRTWTEPRIGHIEGDGQYNDNWFAIEPGSGTNAGNFRLRCDYTDTVLYSRRDEKGEPTLGNFPVKEGVRADHWFTYVFEDMAISRIEYNIEQAKILSNTPEVIGNEVNSNKTDVDQKFAFNFSKNKTVTSSFDYTLGFTIAWGTSAKISVPFVVEGQIKVDVSNSHSFKWGETLSESRNFGTTFDVVAPPHNQVTARATVTRANITVPFVIYSKSVKTGFQVTTEGVYNGVTFWNVQCDFVQEPLTEHALE